MCAYTFQCSMCVGAQCVSVHINLICVVLQVQAVRYERVNTCANACSEHYELYVSKCSVLGVCVHYSVCVQDLWSDGGEVLWGGGVFAPVTVAVCV